MEILSVQQVSYQYSDAGHQAVREVSFGVEAGEFLAVLGHNGSGKSTMAKLLNALYQPTAGRILVNGMDTQDEANLWNIRSSCGMVFQNPDNQLVATIVEEDVAFGLENNGVEPGEIRRRVDEALKTVGMQEFADAAPHMLSGGQKQRVAIAGVLAMRPQIIVFDESTAMLDPSGREEVLNTVLRINREEGITIIWITHFMEEVARADRVLVMDDGQIALQGAPREVFTQVDKIREIGLDAPPMEEMGRRLRTRGLPLKEGILTVEEMGAELCRLCLKN
jgi:energy-coupling factor transport system ATP-binding protein